MSTFERKQAPSRKATPAPAERSSQEAQPAGPGLLTGAPPALSLALPGPGVIQQAARAGMQGAGSALPYADQIQQAFGRHDISSVTAHQGPAAAAASQAMGASAYATGEHVVFGGAPDLHTAAHEAAHVVQQRSGARPEGGIGRPGDSYERHADAVAERVVGGASAEGLLGSVTESAGNAAVQRQTAPGAAIQMETRIKLPGRRAAIRLELLPDDELEQFVAALQSNALGNYTINYDEETAQELLVRAQKLLKHRQHVTGKFNVRARAEDAVGLVLSDDPHVLDLAQKSGLHVGAVDNEAVARQVLAPLKNGEWTLILDKSLPTTQGGQVRTKFFGKRKLDLRGEREGAAQPKENAVIKRPPAQVVSSTLVVKGPCQRGDESKTRDAAMGNLSARNYALAVGFGGAENATWEWLHLVGASLGGGNTEGNLIAGTFDSNTLMIPMEQAIVTYSNRSDVNQQNPMTIRATARLWKAGDSKLTWVADDLDLEVEHKGKKVFWMAKIQARQITPMTKLEYDFYHYVFQQMVSSA